MEKTRNLKVQSKTELESDEHDQVSEQRTGGLDRVAAQGGSAESTKWFACHLGWPLINQPGSSPCGISLGLLKNPMWSRHRNYKLMMVCSELELSLVPGRAVPDHDINKADW